jgi:hypothetical protein
MKITIYRLPFLKSPPTKNVKHNFLLQINNSLVKCFDMHHMSVVIHAYEKIDYLPENVAVNPLDPLTDPIATFTINSYEEFYPTLQKSYPELFL